MKMPSVDSVDNRIEASSTWPGFGKQAAGLGRLPESAEARFVFFAAHLKWFLCQAETEAANCRHQAQG